MKRAILDTSIFVALEKDRVLDRGLPEEVAVSAVSLAELELGVLRARDAQTRSVRLRTLISAQSLSAALPIDERTASAYAQLAAETLDAGRRPRINDTWIAATAVVNDATVWTQDADFSDFGEAVRVERI